MIFMASSVAVGDVSRTVRSDVGLILRDALSGEVLLRMRMRKYEE
jgi:hypothetical protein